MAIGDAIEIRAGIAGRGRGRDGLTCEMIAIDFAKKFGAHTADFAQRGSAAIIKMFEDDVHSWIILLELLAI